MLRAQLEAQLAELQRELELRQRSEPASVPGVCAPPAFAPHFPDKPSTPAPLGQPEALKQPLQPRAAQAPGTPAQKTEAPGSAVPSAGAQAPTLDKEQQNVLVCPSRPCLPCQGATLFSQGLTARIFICSRTLPGTEGCRQRAAQGREARGCRSGLQRSRPSRRSCCG